MSGKDAAPTTNETEPVPATHQRANGSGPRPPRKNDATPPRDPRPVPDIDLRALWEERNWTALGGLALLVVGCLVLLEDLFGLNLNLWSMLLVGIGGWLMFDAYQTFQAHAQRWAGTSRNRMLAGGLMVAVGVMGMFDFDLWGLVLLGAGGWLGYDTYQKVEADGGTWTDQSRTRLGVAIALGVIGFFAFFNMGSAWPVILIVIGAAMLYRHFNRA